MVVNQGKAQYANVFTKSNRIEAVSTEPLSDLPFGTETIDCSGLLLLPGIIDVHVHFRQPGMEYKADMESESRAALAGGVTTVLEMPNTNPATTTIEHLREKLSLAKEKMYCNYGFYFGLTNDNCEQAKEVSRQECCGLKLFLGSSTGNMLVNSEQSLEKLFKNSKLNLNANNKQVAMAA